jgi:hypothetical protein
MKLSLNTTGVNKPDETLSDTVCPRLTHVTSSNNTIRQRYKHFVPTPTQDMTLVNRYSSTIFVESLVHRYYARVVPRLTWIDFPKNPWRNTILKIAQRSTCLRLAVGSLVAAYMSSTSNCATGQAQKLLDIQKWLHNASLQALNNRMRLEQHNDISWPANTTFGSEYTEILTCMLVLCYSEAFIPGSTVWGVHLRACRIIIDYNIREAQSWNSFQKFLHKEVMDLEKLNNIFISNLEPSIMIGLPFRSVFDGSFWAFTTLMQEINAVEKERHNTLQEQIQVPKMDMTIWHARAEQAYYKVLTDAGSLPIQQDLVQSDFEAILRVHYHTCLIYSYQAFTPCSDVQAIIEPFLNSLIYDIQSMLSGPTRRFSQDLFFPLFIAGTGCCGDLQRQSLIRRLFIEALYTTNFFFDHTALKFLHFFWAATNVDKAVNWMQYARQTEMQDCAFVPIGLGSGLRFCKP